MKFQIILLFPMLFWAACTPLESKRELARAEVLLQDAPDSALALLGSISSRDLRTQASRARHALLYTMAQDKCYLNISDDSTILTAYEWYRRHGRKKDKMLTSYYLGIARQSAIRDAEAAILFRHAEELADDLGNYRWKSLCEQHLSSIFAANYDEVRALSYARKSLEAAVEAGDSLMADYCRLDVADVLLAQSRIEEAKELLQMLKEEGSQSAAFASYVSRSLAKLYLFQPGPDYEKAKECYEEILGANVIKLTCQDYGHLGILSEYNGETEIAEDFCSKAAQIMHTPTDSVTYYTALVNIFDLRGDIINSYRTFEHVAKIQDRIVATQLEQSVTHAMENYYLDQIESEKSLNRFRLTVSVFVGLLLIVLVAWLVERLKQSRKEVLEKMAQIDDFNKDIEKMQKRDRVSQQLLSYNTNNNIHYLNSLATAYFSWEGGQVRQKDLSVASMTKEEMLKTFQQQLESLRKDASFYTSLEISLNVSYDNLMIRAREELTGVKKVDYELLVLFFAGFSAKSICFLKNMNEATVRMRKTRIKQFFAALPDGRGEIFVKRLSVGE